MSVLQNNFIKIDLVQPNYFHSCLQSKRKVWSGPSGTSPGGWNQHCHDSLCVSDYETYLWKYRQILEILQVWFQSTTIGTCHWHLPPTSIRIKSRTDAAADFQHPLKGVQGEEQKWSTLCLGKTGRTGLQIDIFRNWFYEPNSCTSLYLEKH